MVGVSSLSRLVLAAAPVSPGQRQTDAQMFLVLAGCSLAQDPGHPGKNWVSEAGGLPDYICRIARAVKKSGHTTSEAIAIAVGTARNWAHGHGGNVTASTRAKAAEAVAAWEALKAKSHALHGVRATGKVAASRTHGELVCLCADTFNLDTVTDAFDADLAPTLFPHAAGGPQVPHIVQLWSNFVICTGDLDADGDVDYYKVPYSVSPTDQTVSWGDPVEVRQDWVESATGDPASGEPDMDGSDMSDEDWDGLLQLAGESMAPRRKVHVAATAVGRLPDVPESFFARRRCLEVIASLTKV